MPQRTRLLERWLEDACRLSNFTLAPASADASFRRYFRITLSDGATLIAMDAPPDKEDCGPFLAVGERMNNAGVHVPAVIAQDLEQGFLLLEDLGDTSYLSALGPDTADELYGDALSALLCLQARAGVQGLPRYDRAMLLAEMQLFSEWLLDRHLGVTLGGDQSRMVANSFDVLADNALVQPVVCVHRDFHSRNLMRMEERNPGVIDFQDAVAGPITYDLVSLLRDCYVRWPDSRVEGWRDSYLAEAIGAGVVDGVDRHTFMTWFDLMGIQRHLKAAGIFARLHHRDGKPGYLGDIPRTLGYVRDVGGRHDDLRPLARLVDDIVLPCLG